MTPKKQDSAAQTSMALYTLAAPLHHMTDKQNPRCEPAAHRGDQHANTFCHPGSRYSSIWQGKQEHLRHRLFWEDRFFFPSILGRKHWDSCSNYSDIAVPTLAPVDSQEKEIILLGFYFIRKLCSFMIPNNSCFPLVKNYEIQGKWKPPNILPLLSAPPTFSSSLILNFASHGSLQSASRK